MVRSGLFMTPPPTSAPLVVCGAVRRTGRRRIGLRRLLATSAVNGGATPDERLCRCDKVANSGSTRPSRRVLTGTVTA
jgi:hypothetical protein